MNRLPLVCSGAECATPAAPLGWVDLPDDHPAPDLAVHGYLCERCAALYRDAAAALEYQHRRILDKNLSALPAGLEFLVDAVTLLHGPPPTPELAVPAGVDVDDGDTRRRMAAAKPVADDWLPPGYDTSADDADAAEALAALELELELEATPPPG